jgi:hypothetical protein
VPARRRQYAVHNREFTSLLWFTAPGSRDHFPNAILQPLILTLVYRAGWPPTGFNVSDQVVLGTVVVWRYPSENLIGMGQLFKMVGWFTGEEHTS